MQSSSEIVTHQQTSTQLFLQSRCPSSRPTNSVRALKRKVSHSADLPTSDMLQQVTVAHNKFTQGSFNLVFSIAIKGAPSYMRMGWGCQASVSPLTAVPSIFNTPILRSPVLNTRIADLEESLCHCRFFGRFFDDDVQWRVSVRVQQRQISA